MKLINIAVPQQEQIIDSSLKASDDLMTMIEFIKFNKIDINDLYIKHLWLSLDRNEKSEFGEFSIELNDFIIRELIGFKGTKSKAKDHCTRLLKLFAYENIDFIVKKVRPSKGANPKGGNPNVKIYHLTPDCFKLLVCKANTEHSDKVYRYYIALENIVKIYTKYQSAFREVQNIARLKDANDQLKIQEEQHQQQMIEFFLANYPIFIDFQVGRIPF